MVWSHPQKVQKTQAFNSFKPQIQPMCWSGSHVCFSAGWCGSGEGALHVYRLPQYAPREARGFKLPLIDKRS